MASDASQKARMARDSSPVNSQAPSDHRILRWLGYGLGTLFLALFLAWLSFPVWAPGLIHRAAPDGWNLEVVDLARPGLSKVHAGTLKASQKIGGMELRYDISALDLAYPDLALAIETLEISILEVQDPPESPGLDPGSRWQDFSLPRITLAGGLPEVRIEQLSLHDRRTAPERHWDFEGLILTPEGESFAVELGLGQVLSANDELILALDLNPWRLEARLLANIDRSQPWVSYTQQSTPDSPTGREATAQLIWSLDLAALADSELLPLLGLEETDLDFRPRGTLTGQLNFSGIEALFPQDGTFGLEAVELAQGHTEWFAAGSGTMLRSDQGVRVDVSSLEVRGRNLPDGILNTIEAAGNSLGLAGLIGSEDNALFVNMPADSSAQSPAPVSILLAENGTMTIDVPAGLDLTWRQSERLELAGTVRDLAIPALRIDDFASSEFSAALQLTGQFLQPVTHTAPDRQLGATTGEFAASLAVNQNSARELSLTGVLEKLNLSGASFAAPDLTARLQNLSLTGRPRLADRFEFEGELEGSGLVFAAQDNPLVPPLLTAGSLNMDFALGTQDEPKDSVQLTGTIALNQVSLPIAATTADRLEVNLEPLTLPQGNGQLRLLTTGLATTLAEQSRSGFDLDLAGNLDRARTLTGEGELLLGYQASLPFAYETDLETRTGSVTLEEARLSAGDFGALAKPLGLTLPQGFRFVAGDLVLNGNVQWTGTGLGGALDLTGEDIGMALGESSLEALNFRTGVNLDEILTGGGTLTMGLARLAAGLEVISLNTGISISSGESFGLEDLGAGLLGGQLSAPSLRLESGRLQSGSIHWEGFDLSQLLRFVDVSGLDGTGTMDARFPIVNEPGGIAVREGSFSARGPGQLRYNTGIPATNIGLQALENFQYDELSGALDYGSDGAYTLGINLLGKNPDLYGGHPIRFRLNLGGAMPALFRSLFITGDFDKAIVERLRSGDPLLAPEASTPLPDPPDSP